MPFQTCSKPAVSSLVVLVMLATITPATLSFRHLRASQEEPVLIEDPQDGPKPPSLVKDEEQALAEFLETYRLAPGQNLKRIPPPRPKGIRVWYGRKRPRLGDIGGLHDVRAMAFAWRDPDQLHVSSSMFGRSEGWTIRQLPRWLGMGLYSYEIEGDPELLKTEVGGDWIVREGVPAEQLVQPLEAILQRAIRQRITLALRRGEREVVVARGRYHPSPLPGHADGEIEVYARELAQDDDRGDGVGVFPAFLKWTAEWIGRPIVNEVESPPKANIVWHSNQREASTEQTRHEDRDEMLVLKHLQEQTGLTFTREKRPIQILFVERAMESK
jgi:Protein of unknown function (DUF3738)